MTTVRVDARGPFDHEAARALLTAHAIPGAEEIDGAAYRRVLALDGGPVLATVALDGDGVSVELDREPDDPAAVRSLVTAWFDLDRDLGAVGASFARDALLAPLVAARPGLRLIGYPSEFEAVATTVVGQQVSLAAARTFSSRLVAAYGAPYRHLRLFPDVRVLAALDPDEIRECAGLTRARARTLHEVAVRWADGDLLAGLDADDARRLLLAVPGIGLWTADYLLVRALQHPDTFAPGDLVARRALGGIDQKQAAIVAERWSPYRSYALLHLWTETAYL